MRQLFSLTLFVILMFAPPLFSQTETRYRIALVSDPHCSTDPKHADYLVNFEQVIRQVNQEKVDAVLISGDLTQTLNPESAELFKKMSQRFNSPVRWVPGNHDLGQRPDKDKPATVTPSRIKLYESLLGPAYWSAELLPDVHVIGIAGSLFGSNLDAEAAQWTFLESELAKPRDATTLILSHYPPFNRKPDEPEQYFNLPTTTRTRLLDLFKRGNVTAVLSGHLHYPIDMIWDGIPILGAPPVSFGLPKNVQREGWKLLTLRTDRSIATEVRVIPRAPATSQPAAPPEPLNPPQPSSRPSSRAGDAVNPRAHIFYYNWYGAPPRESEYIHWPQGGHRPPEDIGSNFYPSLGPYSSNDPAVLRQHMAWIRKARVGVVTLTWWGQHSFEDKGVRAVLDAAADAGLKVNFHLEPYTGSTPDGFARDIIYLLKTYGTHPAFYRYDNKPLFYLFETVRHPATAWRTAIESLRRDCPESVLLIAQTTNLALIKDGAFDGGYTYDGLAPFKNPNFTQQWPDHLAADFRAANKLFIPSVGPGYWDDRAVPNGADEPPSAKSRDDGRATTYDTAWAHAIASKAPLVTITSFNEWHEGSQIEPAISKTTPTGYTYPPYATGEEQYLEQTARWVARLIP